MNLTIYGYSIKVIKDGIKIDKDFQIPIIEDRAFKYLCNVYPKVIIKFLVEVYGLDESLIESAYFVDPNEPDLRYDDKKMTMDLLVNIAPNEYINIEANTSLSEGIRLKNTNYLFRLIMSKQITGKELIDVKMLQINFDLYSEDYMGGIINIYKMKNELNGKILPGMPRIVHVGLDKVYQNPYNENISKWSMQFLKMLTSRSIKYTEELAGDYEDLKEVARLMKEYSEDTSNLMYYDKEAMNESVRLTDLAFAKEKGINEGKEQGYNLGLINIAKNMLKEKIDIKTISKVTNLTKEEILNLK